MTDPQIQITVKADRNTYTKFKTIAKAKDLTIQLAIDEAMSDWISKNQDEIRKLLNSLPDDEVKR